MDTNRVFEFARLCFHSSGQWSHEPFHLIDWQTEFINLFYNEPRKKSAFLTVARGNGKSTFLSLLALYHLLADNEPCPMVVIASDTRDHSAIIFDEVAKMIRCSPALDRVLQIVDSKKTIRYVGSNPVSKGGILKAVSGESSKNIGHGLNISCLAFDEYHLIQSRDYIKALKYAASKDRQNSTIFYATTAGVKKLTPCWEQYQYSCQVRDGKIKDLTHLPMIYETVDGMDIEEETTWHLANPSLASGIIDKVRFKEELDAAKYSSMALNAFKMQKLNQWCQATCQFIDIGQFEACKAVYPSLHGSPLFIFA